MIKPDKDSFLNELENDHIKLNIFYYTKRR